MPSSSHWRMKSPIIASMVDSRESSSSNAGFSATKVQRPRFDMMRPDVSMLRYTLFTVL